MHGASLVATRRLVCLTPDPSDRVVERIRRWADGRDLTVTVTPLGERTEIPDPTATVGLAVGGDGTFLEAIRAFAPRGVPIAGINRGTLSFLARIPADGVTEALGEILAGEARVRERQRFAVTGGGLDTAGINDVMVEPSGASDRVRTCRVEAFVDGEYLGRYAGGGLAVSTPTGSTAMALSAGGPVHGTGGGTLQVTGLRPDRLGVRPVVFAADRKLAFVPTENVRVTVDGGRAVTTVASGDPVRVTGADRPAHVVRTASERSFVAALAAKLGWALRGDADTAPDRRFGHDRDRWAGATRESDRPPGTRRGDRRAEDGHNDEVPAALRVACRGATAAGDLVARYTGEHGHDSRAAATAERRAEAVLAAAVGRTFPDDRVHTGDELPDGRVWLVDGIDGVTNLEHGNPSYCTSVALVVDGDPVVGVIYAPASGELFAARRGGGAWRNGARVEPTDRDQLARSMLLSGYDPDGAFLRTCYRHARGVRRVGSQALNLCFVAAGSADACWEYDAHPRDVAAGLCILRAAGGRVTTPAGESFELDADERTPLLVSNGPLHPPLLDLLDGERVQ
jgi:myo-inositol-1(or 4)-monophosphatase